MRQGDTVIVFISQRKKDFVICSFNVFENDIHIPLDCPLYHDIKDDLLDQARWFSPVLPSVLKPPTKY